MKNFILFCALLCLLCAASSVHAKKRPQVAVVVAMDYEFAPFNTTMNLKRITPDKRFSQNLPYEIYKRDNYRGIDYRFVTFGYNKFVMANYPRIVRNPGPEPATGATLVLLNDFKPDLIVSAGTAGKPPPPATNCLFLSPSSSSTTTTTTFSFATTRWLEQPVPCWRYWCLCQRQDLQLLR